MYEGRNINKKMNMRYELKGAKMSKGESIQEYFTRVSQSREQLSAIGDTLDEYELVMNTLDCLTIPWYSFIQTLCSRKESMKSSIVWEDCIQEEARVANKEALLREYDQSLAIHTKEENNQTSRSIVINLQREVSKEKRKQLEERLLRVSML